MAKKGRAKRQTIRGMNVDAADLDRIPWDKPTRAANDASDEAITEKQPADKPGQPTKRATH